MKGLAKCRFIERWKRSKRTTTKYFEMAVDSKVLDKLVDDVIQFLERKVDSNYRISVAIAGPPGSGKSTIASAVCSEINRRYQEYLQQQQSKGNNPIKVGGSISGIVKLDSSVDEISEERLKALQENNGINPELVEDLTVKPVKITNKGEGGTTTVIGRGGLPNGIKIVYGSDEGDRKSRSWVPDQIQIAQIIPMDGFHLSRKCLDCFKDPKTAHKRRGSPPTFDSNNYLELCKILAQTADVKPEVPSMNFGNVWEKISTSFNSNMPDIYISSFDHAVKDPSECALCISKFTRVLIFEGLYLLYDQENWRGIYPTLSKGGSAIFWEINAPTELLEERVAKRHLQSGLVNSLEAGVHKFRENDLLNAQTISSHRIDVGADSTPITRIDNL